MKKVLALLLVIMLASFAYAEADFMATYLADLEKAEELQEAATEKIQSFSSIMHGGIFDRVTINSNLGTDSGGDFIALVYMTYPDKTDPKTDMNNISVASVTISTAIEDTCPEAVELAVFWELPEYDANAKFSFVMGEKGFDFGDIMVPKEMVE